MNYNCLSDQLLTLTHFWMPVLLIVCCDEVNHSVSMLRRFLFFVCVSKMSFALVFLPLRHYAVEDTIQFVHFCLFRVYAVLS